VAKHMDRVSHRWRTPKQVREQLDIQSHRRRCLRVPMRITWRHGGGWYGVFTLRVVVREIKSDVWALADASRSVMSLQHAPMDVTSAWIASSRCERKVNRWSASLHPSGLVLHGDTHVSEWVRRAVQLTHLLNLFERIDKVLVDRNPCT
jgi:hypothetical protein